MRAIVTGTGSIATRHLRNLRALFPDAHLAVVSRPQGTGLNAEIQQLAGEHHTDLGEALKQPADLAIIATPAPHHVAQALQSIGHGIPTLIEKPLSVSVAECDRLVTLSQSKAVPVLVGYCLRYHPLVLDLHKLVGSGAIGRVYNIRAEVGQYLPGWRPGIDYRRSVTAQRALGGGALLELSHEIDLVRSLVGMPAAVTAVTAHLSELEIDVEDVAEIILRHHVDRQDVLASIHLDLFRRIPRRRLTIDGDAGSIELDLGKSTLTLHQVSGDPVVTSAPAGFTMNDLYIAEIQDLLESRTSGRPPLASLADGLATLRIALAAAESARNNRTILLDG